FRFEVHARYNPERLTVLNIVPGLVCIVLIFSTLIVTTLSITRERERGTMENLLAMRSEEHTSELQSQSNLVCRLLLEKKNANIVSIDVSHADEIRGVHETLIGDEDAALTDPFFQISSLPAPHINDYALAVGTLCFVGE